MTLLIANQDFTVYVTADATTYNVARGDFWDSSTNLAIQLTGAGQLSVLPNGTTTHQIVGDWEG